ncbi:hypothetical protein BBK82_18190 [Lentzea guizhouensis]|uniref:UmuC domain-containing protein n=1 Tax=Lentzea guizhouensis TaxID=1586287 RepID=A0A1B2HIZ2_9PSEU|nr:hypothetical protein [Lentzea guizhouensis]ANZ37698.1 hypothetical protein BBK82_18190 [Lentzea guizhouensis]
MKDSRLLVVWCPDWPVIAACTATGTSPHVPVAVVDGNEVVATSAVARAEGIRWPGSPISFPSGTDTGVTRSRLPVAEA